MRAVVQRVTRACVKVEGRVFGKIDEGLLVLLGVGEGDGPGDAGYMVTKISGMRVFRDDAGLMNRSALDLGFGVLLVSQFTLYGDARKGRRPSFTAAASPVEGERLYLETAKGLREAGLNVETGVFGAMMEVELVNDGPVTILLDSRKTF